MAFGGRVVTLASGTVSALVRYSVSISARHRHAGAERLLFLDADAHLELGGLLRLAAAAGMSWAGCCPSDELAISVTMPVNLRSLKASTSSRAFWPGAMPHHVHFADVHARLHLVQVRDGHDFGAGVLDRAQHALAQLRIQLADGAVERRDDGGLVQRLLARCPRAALATFDLVVGAFELRLGHVAGGFEPVEVRFRKQLAVEQFLVALVVRLGLFQVRLGRRLGGQRRIRSRPWPG